MKAVFADKISRQRAARAHDPLIMKVLSNAAIAQAAAQDGGPAQALSVVTPSFEPDVARAEPAPDARRTQRASRPRTIIRDGVRLRTAFLAGLAVASAATAGLWYARPWLEPGVVVVTSEPPGASVALDGKATGLVTPAVVEDVSLAAAHEVALTGDRVRPITIHLASTPGRLVARAHAALAASLGDVRVESDPPGADVRLDGRPAGRTPVTIPEVRLDERHRVDLTLAGHEIDQFVVLPEKDGVRFARKLARAERKQGP
jgi:hypothetical protein